MNEEHDESQNSMQVNARKVPDIGLDSQNNYNMTNLDSSNNNNNIFYGVEETDAKIKAI